MGESAKPHRIPSEGVSAGFILAPLLPCLLSLSAPTLHKETWVLAADQVPRHSPCFIHLLLPT